jgi:hypothetical protein
VVPHAPLVLNTWLVGGDVQALVDLARVGDDYLSADLQRQLERNR